MILGIGGISRSGKSFLATEIVQSCSKKGCPAQIIEQDTWVLPEEDIPKIRDHIDWEIPESIDWVGLIAEVERVSGEFDLTVVEGLLIYSHPKLLSKLDRIIHIDLDQETFVSRKKQDLRWGLEPDWYIQYIWEAHQRYGRPAKHPDLILNGAKDFDLPQIIRQLKLH